MLHLSSVRSIIDFNTLNQVVFNIMSSDNKTKEELIKEVSLLREEVEQLRREREESRIKEEQLQSIIDAIPLPIFYKNKQGLYIGCNKRFTEMLNLNKEDIIGKTVYDISPERLANVYRSMDNRLLEENTIQNYVSKVKYSNNTYHDVMFHKNVYKNSKNEIDGIVGIMIDISEQNKAEIALSKRLHYERALSRFSRSLLRAKIDFKTTIKNSTKYLLEASQSDHIYVYKNSLENNELIAEKISGVSLNNEKPSEKRTSPDKFYYEPHLERWTTLLKDGEAIKGLVKDFPEDEYKILSVYDAVSMLILPIASLGHWYGFIAFEDNKNHREWSEEDVRLLQTSADMLGAYIEAKYYEEELRKSKIEYENIVEEQTEFIARFSHNKKFTFINQAICKLLNLEKEQIIGHNISELFGDNDIYKVTEKLDTLTAQNPIVEGENSFTLPNNQIKWFKWTAKAIFDKKGNISEHQIIATDITKLKATQNKLEDSLKEKVVLIKEIHHRVKNNLQVIASILNLQSRTVKDDQLTKIFKETRHRIYAMGLVYEKLYQSQNLAKLDFKAYIGSLIVSLYTSYKKTEKNVVLNPDIQADLIDIDIVNPCGMIVNELISNSLKHAFPDDRKGEINVKFYQDEEYITLIISDNGIGMPEDINIDDVDTLGLELVLTLVDQLKGDIHLNRNNGTEFIITFPSQV